MYTPPMMAEHVSKTALTAITIDSLVFIIPSLGIKITRRKGGTVPLLSTI
jgi:hypothetical protein